VQGGITRCTRHRLQERVFDCGGRTGAATRLNLLAPTQIALCVEGRSDEFDASVPVIVIASVSWSDGWRNARRGGWAQVTRRVCGRSSVV
jgi:hypothetical protein